MISILRQRSLAMMAVCVGITLASMGVQAQAPAAAGAPRPVAGGISRVHPEAVPWDNHEGWTPLFDGKSLAGWDGASDVWHVEGDAIAGVSSDANPSGTTNLILKGQNFANFRLRLDLKMEGTGANGGVQYRSKMAPARERPVPPDATPEIKERMAKAAEVSKKRAPWAMAGYQADFNYAGQYVGQLYEQTSTRGIMTFPGDIAAFEGGGQKGRLLGSTGTPEEAKSWYKKDDWNQLEIIADGHTLTHILNGHIVAMTIDTDPEKMAASGLIALEIEGGGTLKILHRNIYIKRLP